MRALAIALIGALLGTSGAFAQAHDECAVAAHLVPADYPLPRVATAIANKQLNIVVMGTASSLLAGPAGAAVSLYVELVSSPPVLSSANVPVALLER